jgi:hypothetical protein
VDNIGDVTVTNDGATILKQLEVEHPAARVLVDLAELQDAEVGDGTTSVVILAAELLKRANDLVRAKVHPVRLHMLRTLAAPRARGCSCVTASCPLAATGGVLRLRRRLSWAVARVKRRVSQLVAQCAHPCLALLPPLRPFSLTPCRPTSWRATAWR